MSTPSCETPKDMLLTPWWVNNFLGFGSQALRRFSRIYKSSGNPISHFYKRETLKHPCSDLLGGFEVEVTTLIVGVFGEFLPHRCVLLGNGEERGGFAMRRGVDSR